MGTLKDKLWLAFVQSTSLNFFPSPGTADIFISEFPNKGRKKYTEKYTTES